MDHENIRSGQRVRVTSLQPVRGWQGWTLITIPAGRHADGVVQNLNGDGFFELWHDNGEVQSFNAHDTSISVTHIQE